jgi:D-alanyl-lipoteichoic acid acyltransferase DltB (MBOAT superfamily)
MTDTPRNALIEGRQLEPPPAPYVRPAGAMFMLFSSYEFMFIFLPAALAGYFGLRLIASKTVTLLWLIVASLTFYAVRDPWNLLVLFSSIGFNFICGTNLAKRARAKQPTGFLLTVGVAFNLALIGYFKYSGFFATNMNATLGTDIPVLNLALPLAISFFTFQEIAYLVDSSRGETYGYRFKDYALMVVFFPHLIAGPIVNHRILMRQFMSKAELKVSAPTLALGIGRLPLNFNSPYKAMNIIEFWRRWHMSLSAFLRDYLYFALGGNHRGEVRRYANLLLTMLLGGLWQGAGWTGEPSMASDLPFATSGYAFAAPTNASAQVCPEPYLLTPLR